jgi:hypothetical protein
MGGQNAVRPWPARHFAMRTGIIRMNSIGMNIE